MAMTHDYITPEPARAELDARPGPMLLEFGSPWCGHCMAAQPLIATAFEDHPDIPHFKIADGKGKRLGRSFGVKLWPTLVFIKDGREVARLVRPQGEAAIQDAFAQLARA